MALGWFWGFDGVQDVEGGCAAVFGASKVVGVRFSMGLRCRRWLVCRFRGVSVVCHWFWGFDSFRRVEGGGLTGLTVSAC